ncbi:hypothetical protein [Pendulispora albinea]|uniref:Uncharacterized protein n=1 Tax=Pendulispora albinea TaxID=2741071 RepID=A0ABZ2LTQ1_9BACT
MAWTCVHSRQAWAADQASPADPVPAASAVPAKCEVPAGANPALADIDPAERTRFIRDRLHHDAANARIWSWGWGLGNVAAGAASFTLGVFETDKTKRTWDFIWAGAALIPPALIVFFPLSVMKDSRELDGVSSSDLGTCATVGRAEALLERDAEQEESGIAWYNHALEIGLNVAIGVTLGYALDDWVDNSISAGAAIVLVESQLFTQPVGAIRARKRYFTGDLSSSHEARESVRWMVTPLALPHASGIAIGARF